MGESERIIVKKIYVGRAALFGLYYGILMGLLMAVLLPLIISTLIGALTPDIGASGSSGGSSPFGTGNAIGAGSLVLSALYFGLVVVFSVIGSVFFAVVYNIVSKVNGSMHVDLEEYVSNSI